MSRPTILFVDDEPIIRKTLPVILEKHGYEVTTAGSPSEALAIIGSKKFDVLISDLNIGEAGDGFTVLSAVRRTHPETRTLLLTGYPDFTAALEAIRQQVDDFLVKPTQIPDMLDKVARLLSRSTLHKDAKLGKRLWQLMQEDKEKILAEWLRKAEQDSQLSLRPLPASERLEPLSGRLDELIEVLQSCDTAGTTTQLISARLHGKTRRSQDYSIGMLVEEAHILERCIFDCMQSQLLSLDISQIISDVVRFVDSSQLQLRESLQAFLEDRRPNQSASAGSLDARGVA